MNELIIQNLANHLLSDLYKGCNLLNKPQVSPDTLETKKVFPQNENTFLFCYQSSHQACKEINYKVMVYVPLESGSVDIVLVYQRWECQFFADLAQADTNHFQLEHISLLVLIFNSYLYQLPAIELLLVCILTDNRTTCKWVSELQVSTSYRSVVCQT